ncbi:hypothetical protein EHM76_00410 [bacterium]|nr:MAG: hypothetical protein EHM76_00410 [bacterium]
MAKTTDRQGTEYVALPKGVIDTLSGDEPVTDEEMAFDEFVSGMSAERMGEIRVGKIKVAKDGTPIANTKSAHCFSAPIDQFTYSALLEHIRARHGAGLYRVVGVEAGKRGLIFNRLLEIAEELNLPSKTPESSLQNPANMLESVGRIMAESAARTEGLIARLSETKPAAADPMDMMLKMGTLMATLMGAAPKPAGGDDLLGSLEKLAKVKELLGSFSGDGGGGGGAEANFYDVVKTGLQSFGPALAALAMKTAAQAPSGAPALAAPVAPYTPIPPVQGIPPTSAQGDPAMASFKRQVDTLVQNAKNNVDPMQLAGTILDLTPDEKLDALADMIEAPDMIEKMAALNPEVQVHRVFFDKLRAALLSLLQEDETTTLPGDGQATAPGGSGAPTA